MAEDFWLETDRLALRRFAQGDLEWLLEFNTDPNVTRYAGGPKTRAHVEELLHVRILDYYDQHPGCGIWMTVERATGAAVGFHLLNDIRGESWMQVGFFLSVASWGRGYATEMAHALLAHGFLTLGLPRIAGMADPRNFASQHVLMKIGLHGNGERALSHPAYAWAGPLAWYEREAGDWIAEQVRPQAS